MARLPLRRNEKLMVFLVFAALTIAICLAGFAPPIDDPYSRALFHLRNGSWEAPPEIAGGMWGLQVSPHGTVWTAGARDSGLYRLSADRWTHYGREQFGSPDDWLQGGFAVHQEQVWGPTGQGIVRFDGESWKFYAYRFKHGRPMATVAGRAGVWILEGERTLTYFDGRNEFSLPLPKNAQKVPVAFDRWDRRSLILTGDDHLWFLSDGLWRWERGAWREIRSDLHLPDAVPVGHSQDRVWLWLRRSGEVVSITPDGSVARRAGLRELGLEYGTQIRDVAESRGEIRIATDEGLVSFENGKWRNFRRPPGTAAVTDVALGPDGSTWVIGETRPIGNLIRSRSLPLGIAMLSMVALGILISKWLRGKAENNLASEEQLVAAAGPLPGVDLNHAQAGIEQQDRWVSWRLCYVLAGILFAGILEEGLAWRLQNRWPAVPHWIISVAIVLSVVCLVPAFSFWVTRRRFIRNGVMVSFWRYRKAARKPAKLLLCIAIVTVLGFKPATWMASVVPNPLFSALAMLPMAFVPLAALFAGRDIIATLMVRPAWRVGNYDRALRILHRLSLGLPSMKIVDLLGVTYALAGRPSEAEAYIRTVLANTQANAPANQCSLLGCLAEAIGDQGRLEEARRCLEASVAIGDDVLGSSRVDLAELLLQQGSEPLRALRLLDEALSIAKGPIGRLLAPARASSRAWALALLGRRDEAAAAIETSMTFRREAQAALFADTRLKAGMALLVMDQKDKALEQFRAAREADSQGKVGARAARQIELLRA